jgi:hypothetical protein
MQPDGSDQPTCSPIEDEVRKIQAELKVTLGLATSFLSGVKRWRFGDPRQKPEMLTKLCDRLDEGFMQLRRIRGGERTQLKSRRLKRLGNWKFVRRHVEG